MGYHRAGFEVVGIDIEPQPHYPFEFHLGDALEWCREHAHEFDVVHASPPCQKYTGWRKVTLARFGTAPDHPDLIAETRRVLTATGKIYLIENVQNSPLHTQFILCGAALGLPHIARHRHFESNFMFFCIPRCVHRNNEYTIGVYGARPDGRRVSYRQHRLCRVAKSLEEAQAEMGIDWMDWDEIREAVPPVYTEFIGRQLIAHLEGGAAFLPTASGGVSSRNSL
jgi:DNA (cytosine-5)-methyltransferase 1